jgi:hypothetical protein
LAFHLGLAWGIFADPLGTCHSGLRLRGFRVLRANEGGLGFTGRGAGTCLS